ncbi:LacI family DNA-binding transcriptional regulator [Naumannella cuiyingiana]|uniref:LacI family transcriptional regulator n=1 Tax=Naumannella cuiyingiana TaxID=1347891 RepID=A0A7Z0D5X4_9ACTN|nr:LacI family DNA-binding transcriptional regulator [Naumannella cuiyingiana]NYI69477.1 LacI family transcriptional regulator [Naumannella cuiyingiana]
MARGRPTIYTIAERAGVSISTVSLAINHPQRVAPNTRRRIAEVAAELGYRPDTPSGERRGGRRGGVGVAGPFTSVASYARRLNGILTELRGTGIDVTVYDLPSAERVDAPLLDTLPIRPGVDGIIVLGIPLSAEGAARLSAWGPPVVLIDVANSEVGGVRVDDLAGGELVGSHLAALGHRRVAFVHPPQRSFSYVSAGMLRHDGLVRALGRADGPTAVVPVEVTDPDPAAIAEQVLAVPGVTAAFAHTDLIAGRLRAGLIARGIGVPDQFSVVGYDDGELAETLGLTTVRQPLEETGRAGARMLLDLMDQGACESESIILDPELVERATTAPAPA